MLAVIMTWWKRRRQARLDAMMFERHVVVTFDDTGVSVSSPSGETRHIAWAAVDRVAIETNDSGPWGADVWWLLEGAAADVAYPQGATGDPEMLDQYPIRFPGFNHENVVLAMGCTLNAHFLCWERR